MDKNRLKIALTGGIASGKTTVLSCFSDKGILTASADEIYDGLLKEEDFVREIYASLNLQPPIVGGKPCFDRKTISAVVFADKNKLEILNKVTHKRVYGKIEELYKNSDKTMVFEIPLLFESAKQDDFDLVLVVQRKLSVRIKALMERNGLTEKDAVLRIKNQVDYDKKLPFAHTVIHNDGSLSELRQEVDGIIEKFKI